MSFRDDSEDGRGDIRKPFLHTGSWYRMSSRQSSMMGSSQAIRDSSVSVVACVLIVALGPIQFGFTVCNLSSTSKHFFFLDCFFMLYLSCLQSGYSSPTQASIMTDLGLTVSEVCSGLIYVAAVQSGLVFFLNWVSKTIAVCVVSSLYLVHCQMWVLWLALQQVVKLRSILDEKGYD